MLKYCNFPNFRCTVKSCIKAAALYAIFQLFGAASIQVRLSFEGGLYVKSRIFKTRKSGLAHVKWKWNLTFERSGESGATHDTQSASRSGVEARVARNLNGWDNSDAGLSQGWVRCPSGLTRLHHSRLSTRSPYRLYSFSSDRRVCYDNYGSFVYDSPNLFCCPLRSVRTGLTGLLSEPGPQTHLTSLLRLFHNYFKCKQTFGMQKAVRFSPTSTTLGRFFRAAASIYTSAAYVQLEFGESTASIRVRLLIKCGFYTRLYSSLNSLKRARGQSRIWTCDWSSKPE